MTFERAWILWLALAPRLPAAYYTWWRGAGPDGADMNSPVQYDMFVGGSFHELPDGDLLYFGAGWNRVPVYRISGWNDFQRQSGKVQLKRAATDDDVFSHLMYPAVFADFAKHAAAYSDVSVLPTPAFFYGLNPGEEISVSIEEGKVLIIRLISVSPPDKDGRRTISYELNGIGRETFIIDRTIVPKTKARPKADLADVTQVAAPIPGFRPASDCANGWRCCCVFSPSFSSCWPWPARCGWEPAPAAS